MSHRETRFELSTALEGWCYRGAGRVINANSRGAEQLQPGADVRTSGRSPKPKRRSSQRPACCCSPGTREIVRRIATTIVWVQIRVTFYGRQYDLRLVSQGECLRNTKNAQTTAGKPVPLSETAPGTALARGSGGTAARTGTSGLCQCQPCFPCFVFEAHFVKLSTPPFLSARSILTSCILAVLSGDSMSHVRLPRTHGPAHPAMADHGHQRDGVAGF